MLCENIRTGEGSSKSFLTPCAGCCTLVSRKQFRYTEIKEMTQIITVDEQAAVRYANSSKLPLDSAKKALIKAYNNISKWKKKTPSNGLFGEVEVGRDNKTGIELSVKDGVIVSWKISKLKERSE